MLSSNTTVPEILLQGSQYMLHGFPVLGIPDQKRSVKYFSLNPFLPDQENRCPIECSYCICHQDSDWHHHPQNFTKVITPPDLLDMLLDLILATSEGSAGFPISLCDYSDPFIRPHQERVLNILNALIDRKAKNMVYITTKVHPGKSFLERLKVILSKSNDLRVTVFVSLAPLKNGYEEASIQGRVELIKELVKLEIPCCWYLRPLVEEWFDEELMWKLTKELIPHIAHHIILSGIVMSEEIEASLSKKKLFVPKWDRDQPGSKQFLSFEFEAKLRSILQLVAVENNIELGPIMRHRLCGTNGDRTYGCAPCCHHFKQLEFNETKNLQENNDGEHFTQMEMLDIQNKCELKAFWIDKYKQLTQLSN